MSIYWKHTFNSHHWPLLLKDTLHYCQLLYSGPLRIHYTDGNFQMPTVFRDASSFPIRCLIWMFWNADGRLCLLGGCSKRSVRNSGATVHVYMCLRNLMFMTVVFTGWFKCLLSHHSGLVAPPRFWIRLPEGTNFQVGIKRNRLVCHHAKAHV
jgi:hypothetical protein